MRLAKVAFLPLERLPSSLFMQKTFLGNIVVLIVLNLLIKPMWVLGIDVSVQRLVGPAEYGMYFDLLSFAFLFMAFVDFGLNNFNNRAVSRETESMPEQLARLGTLKLLLGLFFFLVLHLSGRWLGYSADQLHLLWGTGAIIFLSSFLLFMRSNISGIQWYRADVLMSVLDRSLAILMAGALIWGGATAMGAEVPWLDMTIERFVLVQIIAYTLAIVVAAVLLMRKGARLRFVFDLKSSLGLLRRSFPYMLLTLLMVSYHRMDVVMIERMMPEGPYQAGLYAQAYKLLDASVMFAFLFSTLLLPMFSKMLAKGEEISGLVRLAETLMLVPAAIVVVAAAMYAEDLMDLLYIEGVAESAAAFATLMAALIPIATTYIYGTMLTAKGDLRTLNLIAAIGAVVNIVGNYVLIGDYGLKGAALMTLLTQSIVAMIQVIYAHRTLGLTFGRRQWRNLLLTVTLFPLWCRLNVELFDDWRIEIVVYLLGALLIALGTGLFSIKKLGEVVRMRE